MVYNIHMFFLKKNHSDGEEISKKMEKWVEYYSRTVTNEWSSCDNWTQKEP